MWDGLVRWNTRQDPYNEALRIDFQWWVMLNDEHPWPDLNGKNRKDHQQVKSFSLIFFVPWNFAAIVYHITTVKQTLKLCVALLTKRICKYDIAKCIISPH